MSSQIPQTYRALQIPSPTSPPILTSLPTPPLTPSTVLVAPLITNLVSYITSIFPPSPSRGYAYPTPLVPGASSTPLVPGASSIGRVLLAAPDLPALREGQLVFLDPVIRSHDGSGAKILHGLNGAGTETGRAMMEGPWRDGSFGSVVRVPGENVHVLDEGRLFKQLGYEVADLGFLGQLMVAYGGLRDVDVRPGETVLIAPSTGSFGGAAVHVALALGADVVAMGRNEGVLRELEEVADRSYPGPGGRLRVVKMTGGVEGDVAVIAAAARELGGNGRGTVDVFFDISPPNAGGSSHIKAGVLSLRQGGRMSLMGGAAGDVAFPYFQIMMRGLTLRGTFMYTPGQIDELIKLVETGRLKLGREGAGAECVGVYGLEEWEQAFKKAGEEGRMGRFALLAPNGKDAL
ncbi:NAD(P)-binding protein [Coniochaeta ligniaria NRRL 30616]|uniref:NAD(P)-binding protein n=1 Tax=Coniochaeta ligniaria NRRL 30616 TaxID=1408157 RepID=A0A1J7J1J0_9PEZI|nr:NAD(P)-binding protein [Coniochaeta ligniaria NRRL 30616]